MSDTMTDERALETVTAFYKRYTTPGLHRSVSEALNHIATRLAQPAEAGKAVLERWGFPAKDSKLLLERCPDGYWTPWHIANNALTAAPVLPEVSQADVKAAWQAFNDNAADKTMFAVLNCYRDRVMGK